MSDEGWSKRKSERSAFTSSLTPLFPRLLAAGDTDMALSWLQLLQVGKE